MGRGRACLEYQYNICYLGSSQDSSPPNSGYNILVHTSQVSTDLLPTNAPRQCPQSSLPLLRSKSRADRNFVRLLQNTEQPAIVMDWIRFLCGVWSVLGNLKTLHGFVHWLYRSLSPSLVIYISYFMSGDWSLRFREENRVEIILMSWYKFCVLNNWFNLTQ